MLSDPLFYLATIPAIIIFGISKGGFGGGLGVMSVPLMALVISAPKAAAIMLPTLCLMDLIGLKHYWGRWHKGLVAVMLPSALLGVLLGSVMFDLLSERQLRLVLGLISVVFVLQYFLGGKNRPPRQHRRFWAFVAGTSGGFTSTIAHAGGPPVNVYVLPLQLDKTVFVSSMTLIFAAVNYTKLATYSVIGLFTAEVLLAATVLAPVAAFGMWFGIKLHGKINQQLFMRVCYTFVFIVGLKLLYDGLLG